MTHDREACRALPAVMKIADELHKSRVTVPTKAETLDDVGKLSLVIVVDIEAATVRAIWQ